MGYYECFILSYVEVAGWFSDALRKRALRGTIWEHTQCGHFLVSSKRSHSIRHIAHLITQIRLLRNVAQGADVSG